jgi:hypothetical protein
MLAGEGKSERWESAKERRRSVEIIFASRGGSGEDEQTEEGSTTHDWTVELALYSSRDLCPNSHERWRSSFSSLSCAAVLEETRQDENDESTVQRREDVRVELNFGEEGIVVRATRLTLHLGLQSSEEAKKKEEKWGWLICLHLRVKLPRCGKEASEKRTYLESASNLVPHGARCVPRRRVLPCRYSGKQQKNQGGRAVRLDLIVGLDARRAICFKEVRNWLTLKLIHPRMRLYIQPSSNTGSREGKIIAQIGCASTFQASSVLNEGRRVQLWWRRPRQPSGGW